MASLLDFLPLILKSLPAAKVQMNGKDTAQQQALAAQINDLSNAQVNPDNATYQKLLGQNTEAGQQNLAQTIAELQRQNRKAVSLGRTPLLDQERGGESVFRNLIQGQQDVGNQSRASTLAQLRQSQQALQGDYSNADNLANNRYANSVSKANGYGTIADGLQSLFSLNKKPQNGSLSNGIYDTIDNPGAQGITWNQPRVGQLY